MYKNLVLSGKNKCGLEGGGGQESAHGSPSNPPTRSDLRLPGGRGGRLCSAPLGLVLWRQILGGGGGGGGGAQVVPHNSLHINHNLFRPGVEHDEELPVHVAPAGEHGHAHEEQEHLLDVVIFATKRNEGGNFFASKEAKFNIFRIILRPNFVSGEKKAIFIDFFA